MAIWQHDLRIIPRNVPAERGFRPGERLSNAADQSSWWASQTVPNDLLEYLASRFPRLQPWARDWDIFGTEEGNRIDVICRDGRVEEIKTRFDAREPDEIFLDEVVRTARYVDGLFLTPDLRILEPDLFTIQEELANSPAAAFVRSQRERARDGNDVGP